jgi:hypothetical protein
MSIWKNEEELGPQHSDGYYGKKAVRMDSDRTRSGMCPVVVMNL